MIRLEAVDAEVDAFAVSSSVRTTIERGEEGGDYARFVESDGH
jgi:hypothetical protein